MIQLLQRLEVYSRHHPQEVLHLVAQVDGSEEEVMVFKGISSLLRGATAFDPDVPVLPEGAIVLSWSRFQAPYHPDRPQALATDLPGAALEAFLESAGF
jgi:hypothetical protein